MSAPDPEGFGLLAKVIAAGTALAAPVGWLYTKLDKKADKHTVNTQFQTVTNELGTLRSTQAKIFDQMREAEQRAVDRHERLMDRLLK